MRFVALLVVLAGCSGPPLPHKLGETISIGDLNITPLTARIGSVKIASRSLDFDSQPLLVLSVSIHNPTAAKRAYYPNFVAACVDEHGNSYANLDIAVAEAIGETSFDPGQKASDVLVFTEPVPQAKRLTLLLKPKDSPSTQAIAFDLGDVER